MLKNTLIPMAVLLAAGLSAYAAEPPTETNAPPAKQEPVNCLKETGSRLKTAEGKCIGAPGQVITREQIDQTGSVDTADAIRKLVPAAR